MTAQELEIAIREHEMQRLELKESFSVECIETACAFANASKLVAQVFYDMHLIEHYGSGTRRIKDECLKNGNRLPRWSQQYGSFITVYDSRLKKDETVKEVVNAAGEAVNDPMNGRSDTIKNTDDTINGTINQRREGINEVYEGINEGINEGIKLVLELLNRNSGINAPQIAMLLGKGLSTIERTISEGIKMGVIEHRGSKKTGGYYAVK